MNDPYKCEKCHKEMAKGKALWTKKVNGKLLMVCWECNVELENGKEKN